MPHCADSSGHNVCDSEHDPRDKRKHVGKQHDVDDEFSHHTAHTRQYRPLGFSNCGRMRSIQQSVQNGQFLSSVNYRRLLRKLSASLV